MHQLTDLVTRVLQSNQEILQRMMRIESGTSHVSLSSALSTCNVRDNKSLIKGRQQMCDDRDSTSTLKQASIKDCNEKIDRVPAALGFTFEVDLKTSRPYARAMKRQSLFSPRSSAVATGRWSYLSEFSLADISEVSVINLPISAKDVWNSYHYCNSPIRFEHIPEDNNTENTVLVPPFNRQLRKGHAPCIGSISRVSIKQLTSDKYDELEAVNHSSYKQESPTSQGVRTPSISIGRSGIPMAIVPWKILLLGLNPSIVFLPIFDSFTDHASGKGSSMSGKSTIYNHLQILLGKGFTKVDRSNAREWIANDIIDAFKAAESEMELIRSDHDTEVTRTQVSIPFGS